MADFEKIEIDPATAEARFERSDFAQVVFHNILETYITENNIECAYTITPNLVPSSKDWIGLYRYVLLVFLYESHTFWKQKKYKINPHFQLSLS